MISLGWLIIRLTVGSLLAGHGAQKLFGSFGGYGLEGTAGMMHSLGYRPGKQWAATAGAAEFAGGLFSALGFLGPLGPIAAMSSMLVAMFKAHRGKPIWVTSGGAELPVTNLAALSALTIAGPGAISLDRLFGIRIPRWFSFLALAGMLGATYLSIQRSDQVQAQEQAPATAEPPLEGRVSETVSPGPTSDIEAPGITEGS